VRPHSWSLGTRELLKTCKLDENSLRICSRVPGLGVGEAEARWICSATLCSGCSHSCWGGRWQLADRQHRMKKICQLM
jgi:hypothetical protein